MTLHYVNPGSTDQKLADVFDPGGYLHKDRTKSPEQLAAEEEARKQVLRDRINALYGTGKQVVVGYQPPKAINPESGFIGDTLPVPIYGEDPAAAAARDEFANEDKSVSDATRGYYTDDLNRKSTVAERETRFNLARSGLLGGSEDASQQGQVQSDKELGGTRIDQTVRKAVADLQGAREDNRVKAIGLVNAGAGEEGVRAASAGLSQAFSNASAASRADINSDLFANSVNNYTMSNANAANAALLARYRSQLSTLYPNSGGSGRVTATQ